MVVEIFIIWRLFDLIFSIISSRLFPYLGFFAYQKDQASYHLPQIFSSLANFDGMYYLRIAQKGYEQYEQVFFPLFPLLIRWLTPVFKNPLITGALIANFAFLLGLLIFQKYLKLISTSSNQFQPVPIIIFLLFFPTSFFFGAVYTESLFFLLVVLTFYFLKKEGVFFAGLFAFLAALTRFVGVFLFIPFLLNFFFTKKNPKSTIYHLSSIFLPFLGLLIYMYYLYQTTGDSLNFFHSQAVFGPARSLRIVVLPQVFFRYLKILFTAQINFQYFVSFLEVSTFSFVFIILILDLIKNLTPTKSGKNYSLISLNLFSLVNLLLPTFTGSFMSIPRFSLLSLSAFIFLGQIKNHLIKLFLLVIFFILHLLLLALFRQGYFVA